VHPIHSQQTIMQRTVSGKGIEQGMQQCLKKRRMQCLRKREVRQKKKGDRRVTYFWCYKYITCNLDGSRSQGSYKLVGPLHTSTCFVIFLKYFYSGIGVCMVVIISLQHEWSTMPSRVPRIPLKQLELSSSFATVYSYISTNYLQRRLVH